MTLLMRVLFVLAFLVRPALAGKPEIPSVATDPKAIQAAAAAGVTPQQLAQIQAQATAAFSSLASDPRALAAAAQMGITPAQLAQIQAQTSQAVNGIKNGDDKALQNVAQGVQQMLDSEQGQQLQKKAGAAMAAVQSGETDMKKIAGAAGVSEQQFGQLQKAAGSTFDKVNAGVDADKLAQQTGMSAQQIKGIQQKAGGVAHSFAGGESDVRTLAGQAGVKGQDFDKFQQGVGKALGGDTQGAAREFEPLADKASAEMTPEQLAAFCKKALDERMVPARCRKKKTPPPPPLP